MVFQGFSMILIFQYFSILTPLLIKFSPKSHPFGPQRAPNGVILGSQERSWEAPGVFFASLGSPGDPWAPPWGCPRASWHHFPQFRCPKSPPWSIFHRFELDFRRFTARFPHWQLAFFVPPYSAAVCATHMELEQSPLPR